MTVSKKNSTSSDTFACSMRKFSPYRKKHPSTAFATIAWFRELQYCLNVDTVIAVQRAIEPVSEEKATATIRRWRDYKNGKHAPSPKIIERAEEKSPISRVILELPLWEALRLECSTDLLTRELMKENRSKYCYELLSRFYFLNERDITDYRWLFKRFDYLVSSSDLDSLAILTVCLHLAGRTKNDNMTLAVYRYINRFMNHYRGWFSYHDIQEKLQIYYYENLLCHYCHKDEIKHLRFL